MKKLVFATQVFGLIAMFPIVVILEMNHKPAGAAKSNPAFRAVEETEKAILILPEKQNDKMINRTFPLTPQMFL